MTATDLKKVLKEKKIYFGTNETIKQLKTGKIARVFLANNCPENIKKDIAYYAKLAKIEIDLLKENNEEIGVICKKPFSISVLSC